MTRGTKRGGIDRRLVSFALPCLVVLLGAALRFYDLGAESYWHDEIITLRIAQRGPGASLDAFLARGRPPVHVVLTSTWIRLAGTTEFAARYLSLFAGILSVAAIFSVGRELFGTRVGILSAALMSVSDFQIWYAQETRYYAVHLTLVLLAWLFYFRVTRTQGLLNRVAYIAAAVLMCYAHTSGLFVLVAQVLHALTTPCCHSPTSRKAISVPRILTHILIISLVFPIILVTVFGTRAGTFVGETHSVPGAGVITLILTPLRYLAGEYPSIGAVGLALAALSVGTGIFVLRQGKEKWCASVGRLIGSLSLLSTKDYELKAVAIWLVLPIAMQWVASRVLGEMYIFRYTIGASPAFYLLLSLGMVTVGEVVPELLLLCTIVVLAAPGLWTYYVDKTRENWRDAAAYVRRSNHKSQVVIVPSAALGLDDFDWYYSRGIQACEPPQTLKEQEAIVRGAVDCARNADRFWLVLRVAYLPAKQLDETVWREADLRLVEHRVFKGVLVYLFQKTGEEGDTGEVMRGCCLRPRPHSVREGPEGDTGGSTRWFSPWGRPAVCPGESSEARPPRDCQRVLLGGATCTG